MNRTIPKLALLLVLLMSTIGMNANPIDLRTAQEVAVKFMNANSEVPLRGAEDLQLVTTYNVSRGDAAFYVFNTPNGFVIVSADDCATPILGYSDESQFDVNNIPIQLQDYLQSFVEQIQYGIENHHETDEATARQWELARSIGHIIEQRATTAVAPLLTDSWSQGCYYNSMCPEDPDGPCGHVVTGCAATSFAQIMRYWGYPTNGTGSHAYTPGGYPVQTVDFGATTYDWAHMPNSLSYSSSTTEINAVATLMWHCGVAINMNYAADGSGADPNSIVYALKKYFGYSDELSMVSRNNYSDADWLALMKNCLDSGRPIQYNGFDIYGLGGHGFVCDGYNANNLLHFNWGWGGSCDGYFSINAMNPSYYVFTNNNMAIINIHPGCTSGTSYQITASTDPSNGGTVSGAGTYDCGVNCTLTATANGDYSFMYWTEDGEQVSSDASYSFVAVNDRNLVAHFALPFTITTSANPAEGGTVSGGGACYYNQQVTLIATPNEGYVFDKWTKDGADFSYLSTLNMSVTEAAEYVAYFHQVEGIVVGEATTASMSLPTNYNYTLSQQIYTAEEMGGEVTDICSVSFFNTSSYSTTRNMNIYMVNTDKSSFGSAYDWITVSENDLVFSGSVSMTSHSWVTIYFNTTFSYDGESNVALIVDNNTNGTYYDYVRCRTFATEQWQAISVSGSNTDYDPYNPSSYAGTCRSEKNQVVFGIPSYDYTVTATVGSEGGGTVSGGGGLYYHNQPITLIATANEGYIFKNWTKNGQEVSYVSNFLLSVTESAEYVAHFELQPDGIVIGDGTYTNEYLPLYYYYSLTEQIYTAEEMGGAATEISSVSFFNTGNYSLTRNMNVYMVNTDKSSFGSTSDWISVSENDLVFSGDVVTTPHGWITIYIDPPFVYDGVSNVALIVDDNSNSYSWRTSCRTFGTEEHQAIGVYSYGNSDFNPYNPSGYTGTLLLEKNQVIFGIPSYDYIVTASANPTNGGVVGGDDGPFFYGQPVTLTATSNAGYVFVNWTKNDEVVSYLSNYTLSVTESAEYVANFELVSDGMVVGDGTYTNTNLPTSAYYSLTEQIYTSAEMGDIPCQISSISFFNTGGFNATRNMSVYMANTDKNSFEGTSDWIPVSDNDLVFSGAVSFPAYNWVTVYFSTPFNYDGSSNVALIVDDNSNSYSWQISCRTYETGMSQALCINSSGTNYNPYAPTGYIGTLMSEKNQVIFGFPSYDYTVTATVGSEGGGTVSGGGLCYLNQPITLTAVPNEGYIFSNWTKDGTVVSYLSTYRLSVTASEEYVAHFELKLDGIVIGDATYASNYLPTNSYNSLSEQIYTVNEMGGEATEISSVSFFNTGNGMTRNWNLYLVHTEKTSFTGTSDWIPVSENDLLFSGKVTMTSHSWVTVCFNTPFAYDGVSNVALIVDDNTNSYNSSIKCRTFGTEESQAICVSSYNTNYDPINPSGYTGSLMTEKNQIIFYQPRTVTATANPVEGGTVSGGGVCAYGSTCTLTATPDAGYYFLNWTEDGVAVSYDAVYSFTVSCDRNLVANFVEGESTCTIVFDLRDSYHNGWSGNYLVVDYSDGSSEQFTLESGSSASYSREVATGSTIALSWISGTYTYQCSFDIKFENGVPIYHSTSLNSNFQYEFTVNCAVASAPRSISVFAVPEEGGTVDGAGTYESGTFATVTATPNVGYAFCFWSEDGQQVSTDATYSFLVSSDRDLVARFSLPITVSLTTNMAEGGTITGAGTYYYGNTCTLTATPNEGYLFLNWSKNGMVVSCNAYYSFTVTDDTEIEAVFMQLDGRLIGHGEGMSWYLPSYSDNDYFLSQQIYTPDEIGAAGNITSISYYNAGETNTRSFDIYMVHTDKSSFDSNTDWIPVTEVDRVYRGNVTITKGYWSTIVLDTPFAYDGTSNLAIVVDDNKGSFAESLGMSCRVFNAQGYQAISVNPSSMTNYDPCNLSAYNGTRYSIKNQMIFGFTTSVTQSIELTEGWNWVSLYVEFDNPEQALLALEEALGEHGLKISAMDDYTTYEDGEWGAMGDLEELTNGQMYMVLVDEDIEVTLEGIPSNPIDYTITILPNNWTWIGFPSAEAIAVEDAFADFEAEDGDKIQGVEDYTKYEDGGWGAVGDLEELTPGSGYMYFSNSTQPKTLVIQTGAKARAGSLAQKKNP